MNLHIQKNCEHKIDLMGFPIRVQWRVHHFSSLNFLKIGVLHIFFESLSKKMLPSSKFCKNIETKNEDYSKIRSGETGVCGV